MGMGVDSVQTPGEVSFRSTRLVPPPCHDATPKKMAPSAAEFGVTCTLTVPVLPSADGVSLMSVCTLPIVNWSRSDAKPQHGLTSPLGFTIIACPGPSQ